MSLTQFDSLPRGEQDLWVGRWERKQATCSDCGRPLDECSDPERVHYPFRSVCYVSMNLEAAGAAYDALHKDQPWHDGTFKSWREERSASHPYHYTHGVKFGIADHDMAPWDAFTTDVNASPEKPAEGDQTPES